MTRECGSLLVKKHLTNLMSAYLHVYLGKSIQATNEKCENAAYLVLSVALFVNRETCP